MVKVKEEDIRKVLRGDATSPLKGYLYQFMVALDFCFEMRKGQSIYIETYGDLAIMNDDSDVNDNLVQSSIEVKKYSEKDCIHVKHHNFLNTLYNWSEEIFQQEKYGKLCLFTTQKIRETDVLFNWKEKTSTERYDSVFSEYNNYIMKNESSTKDHKDIEKNIKLMKGVLYSVKDENGNINKKKSKERLEEILSKIEISDRNDNYEELYYKLIETRSPYKEDKGVYCIAHMIGFILNPVLVNSKWQISYEKFRNELDCITNKLGGEKLTFPDIELPNENDINMEGYEDALFVRKLKDIEWNKTIESIKEYLFVSKFIEEEVDTTMTVKTGFDDYKCDLKDVYENKYEIEMENLQDDVMRQSRIFVNNVFNESRSVNFPIYDRIDPKFRKGVYHFMANEETNNIVWKLGTR